MLKLFGYFGFVGTVGYVITTYIRTSSIPFPSNSLLENAPNSSFHKCYKMKLPVTILEAVEFRREEATNQFVRSFFSTLWLRAHRKLMYFYVSREEARYYFPSRDQVLRMRFSNPSDIIGELDALLKLDCL